MTAGSVISAMTLNLPPHSGQMVTSNSNARLSRFAQVSCVSSAVSGLFVRFGRVEVEVCAVRQITNILTCNLE